MARSRSPRPLFWFETALGALSGLLFVTTFLWHDWLEAFGVDPDHGDGSVERLVVLALLGLTIACAVAARVEWRRTAALARS